MQYRKKYIKLPVILITLSTFFQLVLVGDSMLSLWELNKKYQNKYMISWSLVFTTRVKFYLFFSIVALVCLLVYFFIRHRYINTLLCKAHLWLFFTGLVMLPVYEIILSLFVKKEFQAHSFQIGNVEFYDYPFLMSFFAVLIGTVFFILTVIKSSTLPKTKQSDESTGFLDDFAQ